MDFWASLFIKNYKDTTDNNVRERYGLLTSVMGIILNIFLVVIKLVVGFLSDSIAIISDGFNNLGDAASSIILMLGFKIANQKPDPQHPFGHGRAEYLTGLFVSILIIFMAYELLRQSVSKIIHPQQLECSNTTFIILVIAISVKIFMYYYNTYYGKKIQSVAMKTVAMDSLNDCLATFAVLVSSFLSYKYEINIDGYCGLVVSIMIFKTGINAAMDTINPLLGAPADKQFIEKIEKIVLSHTEILGMHDLVVHNYGPGRVFISLHVEVSANSDIIKSHEVLDHIEHELNEELKCNSILHMDPIKIDDEDTDYYHGIVLDVISQMEGAITMHDFRIIKGEKQTSLFFDVIMPFGYMMSESQLLQYINGKVKEIAPECECQIEVDISYDER